MSPQNIIAVFVVFTSLFHSSQQQECTQVSKCTWWQSIIEGCPRPVPCETSTVPSEETTYEFSTETEEPTTEYVEPTTTPKTTTILIDTTTEEVDATIERDNFNNNNTEGHMKCYQCSSSQKGCESDWRQLTFLTCPKNDDKCVKVIDKHGNDEKITRNCLSLVHDAPDDNSKGCRTPAGNENLNATGSNKTNNDNNSTLSTWCFCERDFCNHSSRLFAHFNLNSMIIFAIFWFINSQLLFSCL